MSKSASLPLPPGPRPWPIIGSMFQMGKFSHRYFAQLAKKYGSPIVHVRLGYTSWIVVHTPEIAMEILKTRDVEFAYRPPSVLSEHFGFGYQSIATRQHTDATWRHLRKLCATSIFTTSSLRHSAALRQEETASMISTIRSTAINGGSTFAIKTRTVISETNMNILSRLLFGKKYFGEAQSYGPEAAAFRTILEQVKKEIGNSIHIGDLFPMLRRLDPQGTERNLRDQDMMLAGSDTGTISLEWALSELIRHPHQLSRVQEEIDNVVGQNRLVQESDLPYLPYLNAIFKETLRLHPPAPFLIPHYSPVASHLEGYKVLAGSNMIVNAWAIGRDPTLWTNPEEFNPERFLETDIEFVGGKQFQLLPFSSGRRQCPGYPLATIQNPLILASLIHSFNWGPPAGQRSEDINMDESMGLSLYKAIPLEATVSYRLIKFLE
ncbi:hypothetical protein O6H91_14G014300 [Diphasiastrum complanatum]|uniref:Uncharacterized protein n=2 Tax=Diphasiastrum complanatum TaxID=34168 RepID=A0ACC2BLN5_DIPCM|nr:hypothetical protein O6H91_14G010100 [Diphasiastrum complanatum]KAJ7530676.1 hypothetical protein O6H91_14G014300 [Diphasiastrum complanatum]